MIHRASVDPQILVVKLEWWFSIFVLLTHSRNCSLLFFFFIIIIAIQSDNHCRCLKLTGLPAALNPKHQE